MRKWSVIDGIMPQDEDYRKYMDIAKEIMLYDMNLYDDLMGMVHVALKDTHATESDYIAATGLLYIKLKVLR